MASNIDPANPTSGNATTQSVRDNFQAAKDEIEALQAQDTTHTADIATNTANIATNAADIATNTADIATNTADIATNTADIATNAADIATLEAAKLEAVRTADLTRTSTTVSSDSQLQITLAAGSRYKITGYLKFFNSTESQGTAIKFINNDADIVDGHVMILSTPDTVTTVRGRLQDKASVANTFDAEVNTDMAAQFTGFIETNASVVWTIQWAQAEAGGTGNIMRENSWIMAEKVG